MGEEIKYEDFHSLVCSRARAWSSGNNYYDELISEGYLCFLKTKEKYDPSKSKFSTFFYHSLNLHFRKFIQSFPSAVFCDTDIETIAHPDGCPLKAAALKGMVDGLSGRSKEMVNYVINPPTQLIWEMRRNGSTKMSKHVLQKYLVKKEGWNINRCWESFKEIREAIKEEL